ncbi:hypothetical protein LPUS_11614 [Lasallia pustulata]|uniref:Uncharacterized protein n=1 Tax=Lasallia pustulata TaxID=136370 RepID=A0A1W5DCA7_9LECA|nr:hypothetical protein LPUS_11614 [Lasallia pustulata]
MAYIPSDMVDNLSLDLHTPPSKLYNNPDGSTNTIMSMINPSVPIMAGSAFGGGSPTNAEASAAASSSAVVQDGSPLGPGAGKSSPVKGSSVGIGMGVVAGAAAYGAAMFFVARRYRRRRSSHQRASSVLDSPSTHSHRDAMGGGASAALMSGGRGDVVRSTGSHTHGVGYGGVYYDGGQRHSGGSGSTRGREISAPLMTENSLGWN